MKIKIDVFYGIDSINPFKSYMVYFDKRINKKGLLAKRKIKFKAW